MFFGGDNDKELLQRQLVRMVDKENVDLLIVASVDGGALVDSLKPALNKHIPVISYDRLITGTEAASYYATFDNAKVGQIQGKFLIDSLKPTVDNPKNIEIFYGSLDDNNAKFFYGDAMKILKPYIDSVALKVLSGEIKPEDTACQGWSGDIANKRMGALIEKVGYGQNKTNLDGILVPADCLSLGVILALKKAGYTSDNFPVLTGQDAAPNALKAIDEGYMGMTIFKNPADLSEAVISMVNAISKGDKVEVNDNKTYDNGATVMETFLCSPKLITKANISDVTH